MSAITIITTTTMKMPTPIPALKIPPITLQELNIIETSKKLIKFIFFIGDFKNLYLLLILDYSK
jgi:hypothetical protein